MRTLSVCLSVLAVFAAVTMLAPAVQSEVQVKTIRLEKSANASKYVIEKSGASDYQDFRMSNPPRLVIDLMGAEHKLGKLQFDGDGQLVQKVRTSQFKNYPDDVTRVVFDIDADAGYKISDNGTTIDVSFYSKSDRSVQGANVMGASMGSALDADVTPKTVTPKAAPAGEKPKAAKPTVVPNPSGSADKPAPVEPGWSAPEKPSTSKTQPSTWQSPQLASVTKPSPAAAAAVSTGVSGQLGNQPLTLDIQGADIKTVLRSISEFSGANIIAGPEVEGPVTVHLSQVPWREALNIILRSHGYGFKEEFGIFRVSTIDLLQEEEIKAVTLERKKDDLEPLVSEVVTLNYVNAKEIQNAMRNVISQRGSIDVEAGNNAVIINDIQENVDKISAMVRELDTKVSQVEIVAKMVDVDMEATREMGVNWELLNFMPEGGPINADAVAGQRSVDPFASFRVGTVQSWGDLNAAIDALERENKANIISNPRIVTTDNKEAGILVGKEIPLIVSDEAGNPITELKRVGVILRVTPHVNSDMTITMDIHPEVSELSQQATVQGGVIISLTMAQTRVVVGDGETAVIGGLINEVESSIRSGLPVLKDVPVLGGLFRYESKTNKKRELIIFITPRIIEPMQG